MAEGNPTAMNTQPIILPYAPIAKPSSAPKHWTKPSVAAITLAIKLALPTLRRTAELNDAVKGRIHLSYYKQAPSNPGLEDLRQVNPFDNIDLPEPAYQPIWWVDVEVEYAVEFQDYTGLGTRIVPVSTSVPFDEHGAPILQGLTAEVHGSIRDWMKIA